MVYAGLADCYSILTTYGSVPPREGWAKAKAAAAAAVALDSELAEGHTSLAFPRAFADWDWVAAEEECRRAIELNPAYWVAPYWYATLLTLLGRYDEAEHQIERARELEPLSPTVMHIAALISIGARRYAAAVDRCSKGLEIDPNHPLLRLWLGTAYEQQSRYEEAIGELKEALRLLQGEPMAAGPLALRGSTSP